MSRTDMILLFKSEAQRRRYAESRSRRLLRVGRPQAANMSGLLADDFNETRLSKTHLRRQQTEIRALLRREERQPHKA